MNFWRKQFYRNNFFNEVLTKVLTEIFPKPDTNSAGCISHWSVFVVVVKLNVMLTVVTFWKWPHFCFSSVKYRLGSQCLYYLIWRWIDLFTFDLFTHHLKWKGLLYEGRMNVAILKKKKCSFVLIYCHYAWLPSQFGSPAAVKSLRTPGMCATTMVSFFFLFKKRQKSWELKQQQHNSCFLWHNFENCFADPYRNCQPHCSQFDHNCILLKLIQRLECTGWTESRVSCLSGSDYFIYSRLGPSCHLRV